MKDVTKCEKCNSPLFQDTGNKLKVRTNIIVFEKAEDGSVKTDGATIKCHVCKADNKIPIFLDEGKCKIKHFIIEKKR